MSNDNDSIDRPIQQKTLRTASPLSSSATSATEVDDASVSLGTSVFELHGVAIADSRASFGATGVFSERVSPEEAGRGRVSSSQTGSTFHRGGKIRARDLAIFFDSNLFSPTQYACSRAL